MQGHIAGATTVGIGQRGHIRLRVHYDRQSDDTITTLLILQRDGLYTSTRDLGAGIDVRNLIVTDGQLLLTGGGVTDGHMGRHHAVATSNNRRDCLDIITTLRISLAIPGPAVALIDCDVCILNRIDGQVEGHHAIATIHSLQGSGIVTRGGEDLSIPLILDTCGGGEILHIGRINHCGGTCHNADAVGRIVSIHCIESSRLSNRIGHGAACSDIVRQCGIVIPGSCCASYDISSQGCIAGTADIVARQNRRVRQGVHNYLHRGGRTFALSGQIDIGRLIRCIGLNRRRSIAITLGKLLVVGIVPSDSASGSRSGCQHRTTLSTDSCRCRDCRGCRDFVNSHHQLSQITVALVLIGGHHVEGCSLRNLQGGAG